MKTFDIKFFHKVNLSIQMKNTVFSICLNSLILIILVYSALFKNLTNIVIVEIIYVFLSIIFIAVRNTLIRHNLIIDRFNHFMFIGNLLFDTGYLLTNIYKAKTIFLENNKISINYLCHMLLHDYDEILVDEGLIDMIFSDKLKVLNKFHLKTLQISIFSILSFIFPAIFLLSLLCLQSIYIDFVFFLAFFAIKGMSVGGMNLHYRLLHLKSIVQNNDFTGYLIYNYFVLNGLYNNAFIVIPQIDKFIYKNMKIIDNLIVRREKKVLSFSLSR